MAGNPLLNMMGGNNPMANMMQNNPIMQIINMAKSGKGNPMQMIQQMMGQNPEFGNAINALNGKSETEVGNIINQLAEQKGVNMGELLKSIGAPDSVKERFGLKI